MLSWQGLIIMFLFGVLMTLTVGGVALVYSEWKLERARKKLDGELLRKLLGGNEDGKDV